MRFELFSLILMLIATAVASLVAVNIFRLTWQQLGLLSLPLAAAGAVVVLAIGAFINTIITPDKRHY